MMELGPEFWTKVDEMRLQQEQADAKLEALQAEAESAGADLQKAVNIEQALKDTLVIQSHKLWSHRKSNLDLRREQVAIDEAVALKIRQVVQHEMQLNLEQPHLQFLENHTICMQNAIAAEKKNWDDFLDSKGLGKELDERRRVLQDLNEEVKSVEESLKIGEAYLAKLSADFTKEENQIRQQKETIAKIKKEVEEAKKLADEREVQLDKAREGLKSSKEEIRQRLDYIGERNDVLILEATILEEKLVSPIDSSSNGKRRKQFLV